MKRPFVLTPSAERGTLEIWVYLREVAGERVADRIIGRVFEECNKLGRTPGIGHYREELLDRRHRFWRVGSYIIAYRWQVRPIEIVGIVHGARDLRAYFSTQ